MKRLSALIFLCLTLVSLSGCAIYDGYGYYEDDYYDDGYYDDRYYDDRYYPRSSYGASYGGSIYYNTYPDYVYWSDYYSVLWPSYRYYYDPVFSPHFYYGVTWFPVSYFGLHYSRYQWPYYHAYSPYRYSYWDNYYYDWRWHRRHDRRYRDHDHDDYYDRPRYGSARNEAERWAAYSGLSRYRGMATPGVQVDPYDAAHVYNWRNDGVRGHYPNQGRGPQPYFSAARTDPMDWRQNSRFVNRPGEPADGYDVDQRGSGSAAGEASRFSRDSGWREPAYNQSAPSSGQTRIPSDSGYERRQEWRSRDNNRDSGWVAPAPSMREPRGSTGTLPNSGSRGEIQRYQRDTWNDGNRQSYPSTRDHDAAPRRFETPTPREEREPQRQESGSRFQRYSPPAETREREQPSFERQSRYQAPQSTPRYEQPQRFEQSQRFEQPQRYEQPRSTPSFERQPRYEAPQSQPRFESPSPRFERQERSEPRFESRGSQDSGGGSSAREQAQRSRGDDRED